MNSCSALFKRDFLAFFRTSAGYVILAIFALLGGLVFAISALSGFSIISGELLFLQNVLFAFVPVLTMKTFAAERKSGTDLLLYSSPISLTRMVLGKYTAVLTFFLVLTATTLPHLLLTLMLGGRVDWVTAGAYIAFILTGAAYLTIGLYISARSETQTTAAVVALIVFAVFRLFDTVANVLVSWIAGFLHEADIFHWMGAEQYATAAGQFGAALRWLNPDSRLEGFANGRFDLLSLLYFLSIITLFLFLTIQTLGKRRWCSAGAISALRRPRRTERGPASKRQPPRDSLDPRHAQRRMRTGQRVLNWLVCLVLLALNVTLNSLAGGRWNWDITSSHYLSLGPVSKQLLRNLNGPVELTVLDSEDAYAKVSTQLPSLLADYAGQSDGKLTLHYEDPAANPAVIKRLDPRGQWDLRQTQLVVRSLATGRLKILNPENLLPSLKELNGQHASLSPEQAISAAIRNVDLAAIPTLYVLNTTDSSDNSDSSDLSDFNKEYSYFGRLLEYNAYQIKSLNLLAMKAVPTDAALVMLINPAHDLSEPEQKALEAYVKSGGKLLAAVNCNTQSYPRLNQLLALFNLKLSDDQVAEGRATLQIGGDKHTFAASLPQSSLFAQSLSGAVLVARARAVDSAKTSQEQVTVDAILKTSPGGLREPYPTPEHPLPAAEVWLGACAENPGLRDSTGKSDAKVVLLGSADMLSDQIVNAFGNKVYNMKMMFGAVDWLTASEKQGELLITPRVPPSYSLWTNRPAGFMAASFAAFFLIPFLVILAGLMVRRYRKKL